MYVCKQRIRPKWYLVVLWYYKLNSFVVEWCATPLCMGMFVLKSHYCIYLWERILFVVVTVVSGQGQLGECRSLAIDLYDLKSFIWK